NSPLIPKWEIDLRKEAVIHSAYSSTSIEGNRLSPFYNYITRKKARE
ncbi:unnamed protein product, partial [marine sediment metagenome]